MNYQEAISYLEGLKIFGIRLGLSRITRLLELLGEPQDRYRTIHVTGTNGKGSVSAMLEGILRRSGIHTGFYSSPHLVSYTERIRVDGQAISEQEFADGIALIREKAEQMVAEGDECPTQFEVLTALGFYYFAKCQVEYAVIEVGLGGTLDSTNVITPEVSVITNVTFEHADKLGGTISSIAENKAGIIKEGVPVVTAAADEPLAIIRKRAEEKNADIFVAGEDFASRFLSCDGRTQTLEFTSELLGVVKEPYELHLLGRHQVENSSLAVMTSMLLHNIDERITMTCVREALRLVSWPARFELIELAGQKVLIDGAHNPAGMRVLRDSLDDIFPAEPRVLLLGILKDKDIDAMLDILLRPTDTVVVTMPQSERADTADDLLRRVAPYVQHVEAFADNREALRRALELANKERLLVIAGSLYLVGGVRQMLLARKE
ncbi:folylpolyglutamate synthase/dihydrofolate synthase family protein [Mitsuokella sp.]|uniref:bifunctional folylpolyglutamate synthase/dihydrofolate synthase n=1 Tax=Mitsuokella sp. TaxID=2049034 RepID=UPI0029E62045|nr:folylpolyglutamate synthase/dihydrofolate synthase family protein [Mitsuokella sp.]MDD6383624.1 bifunctional folylpolyglutamate synthase/dihydrofolate synthase [Selenomonadaceae bacterium]MDY4475154.1 folylpolyglutamate synthase/dihydrofolate synthase family protein [Mitsuokella sp.]